MCVADTPLAVSAVSQHGHAHRAGFTEVAPELLVVVINIAAVAVSSRPSDSRHVARVGVVRSGQLWLGSPGQPRRGGEVLIRT